MSTSATSAAAKKARKPLSTLRALLTPLIGFGIGWGSYTLIEKYELISDKYILLTYLVNLRTQRMLSQALPTALSEKFLMPVADIDNMIVNVEQARSLAASGEKPNTSQQERVPFTKILSECRPQEQLEWLEEHIREDIPFFFIGDIFNSWAEVHQKTFFAKPADSVKDLADDCVAFNAPASVFESKVLCEGVWKKMLTDVIPFDVSVRVLCILASKSRENARHILALVDATQGEGSTTSTVDACRTIVRLHREYHDRLEKEGSKEGNVVPSVTVDAATVQLLLALNGALVNRRVVPLFGRPSTGPYPLLKDYRDVWCGSSLPQRIAATSGEYLNDVANQATHLTKDFFKC